MALRPSRVAGVVAGCAALALIAAPVASAQIWRTSQGDRVAVEGSAPTWATTQAKVGRVDHSERRTVQVALALRDPVGAEALAKAVSTPGSPRHGRFLSAGEFTDRFAPTKSTVDRVAAWLRSQGLTVGAVSENRHFVEASGQVGQLEAAFGTTLSTYRHVTKNGTFTLAAPESPISVPRAVRGAVEAVVGLDDSAKTITPQQMAMRVPDGSRPASRVGAAGGPEDCALYWGDAVNTNVPQKYGNGAQSNALCGYTSPQLRAIYGLADANTGAGSSVGIVGAYNLDSIVADTNQAAQRFGAPPLAEGQYSAVLPGSYDNQDKCAPESWYSEQALDVQSAHEIAPAANLTYYAAQSCFDLYNALNRAVSANRTSIVSNSWLYPGESTVPAATRKQMNAIAIQAAVQGQTLLFCSGDSGDNSGPQGKPEATFPASHPWVTAVGGTSVALDGNNSLLWHTGWQSAGNNQNGGQWVPQQDSDGPFAGGAGGGVSSLFARPDYQKGVVPDAVSGGKRTIPDISALADSYTGLAIGLTTPGGWQEFSQGGTSLATPLIAGLVADAAQAQGRTRFGFLNTALYKQTSGLLDVRPVQAGVWTPYMAGFGYVDVPHDLGSYLVDFDTRPQSLQSGPGWDVVTGVGTPTAGFVTSLGK